MNFGHLPRTSMRQERMSVHLATEARSTVVQFNCRFRCMNGAAAHSFACGHIMWAWAARDHCHLVFSCYSNAEESVKMGAQTHSSSGEHYSGIGHAQFMPHQCGNCARRRLPNDDWTLKKQLRLRHSREFVWSHSEARFIVATELRMWMWIMLRLHQNVDILLAADNCFELKYLFERNMDAVTITSIRITNHGSNLRKIAQTTAQIHTSESMWISALSRVWKFQIHCQRSVCRDVEQWLSEWRTLPLFRLTSFFSRFLFSLNQWFVLFSARGRCRVWWTLRADTE